MKHTVNTQVSLSASEVRVLCRRIFFALDLPAGADIEVSESILWLQVHGFSALEQLHGDLPALQQNSYGSIRLTGDSDTQLTLDIQDDLGYFSLIESIDLICSRAFNSDDFAVASIQGVKNVLLMFPLMIRRSLNHLEFELNSGDCRAVCSAGKLWLNADCFKKVRVCGAETVTMRAARSQIAENLPSFDSDSLQLQADAEDLRTRINFSVYRELKEAAAKSFVPSSEQSRSRGAGAEVDDND